MIYITFGCPRSGTTMMQAILKEAGVNGGKIPEYLPDHPYRTDYGLINLQKVFGKMNLCFIKIFRDSAGILGSLMYQKKINPQLSIGKHTPESVASLIYHTEKNTEAQSKQLYFYYELDYNNLQESIKQLSKHKEYKKIKKAVDKIYMKKPARTGRLEAGVQSKYYTEKEYSDMEKEIKRLEYKDFKKKCEGIK